MTILFFGFRLEKKKFFAEFLLFFTHTHINNQIYFYQIMREKYLPQKGPLLLFTLESLDGNNVSSARL